MKLCKLLSSLVDYLLFSPSDICKELSHHFLFYFSIGMGSYDHPAKYQCVFPQLLENSFIRVNPWDEENLDEKIVF
jgi:hypothetical protein